MYYKNVKNGKFISFYRNGNKSEDGLYKDDKKDGIWKKWSIDGKLSAEQNCKALDDETCVSKEWCMGGLLCGVGNYKSGKRDGIWKTWRKNGQMLGEGNYKGGQREGLWIWKHGNGQIGEKEFYKDGELLIRKSFDYTRMP